MLFHLGLFFVLVFAPADVAALGVDVFFFGFRISGVDFNVGFPPVVVLSNWEDARISARPSRSIAVGFWKKEN